MYKLTTLLSLLLLVMLPFAGEAQEDSLYKPLMVKISKNVRVPRSIRRAAKATQLTIVYTVADGKKSVRYFPEKESDSLRSGFQACEQILMEADWAKIAPKLYAKRNFSIVLPVAIYFRDGSNSSNESVIEEDALGRLFDFCTKVAPPYQVLSPLIMFGFKYPSHESW
ncbi:hypothetical protein HGH92_24595 [Chitinophaga varians]|uniref:TonB C-terminal domain-containing protein n=1 Tax=Chitinophaga varians TaxID=2202339 RepID=A0A847S3S9_9BACT|nr:hypothetical protein [Chitinophaga varians]NLR67507.1 hypothetical protein [Chitinophaga varians]